ncbi:MAG TPA: GNAT family N-acetyltransferase [Herpetosiphonaceae bacterium]|nr:GNAT family N-acetyltransferase [Herpetosiphonaceae bacterium]
MPNLTIDAMRPDEAEATGALLGQALHFNTPMERLLPWMEKRGFDSFRVARIDGRLAAALNIIDMGQWFVGRSLRTAGISAVGVAPEFRGRKVGAALMEAMLREMRASGVHLSTLYPATTQFYRTLGYERAGARTIYELVPAAITARHPEGHSLVPAGEAAQDEFAAIYDRFAAAQSGNLDRPAVMWDRALKSMTGTPFRYFVQDAAGERVGYIVFMQGGQFEDMRVMDWCAATPAAGRALLAFVAGHRTLVDKVLWPGAPVDGVLYQLAEQRLKRNWELDWMLRLTDVRGAIAGRGYPAGLAAAVELEIADERLEWNHGRFVLQVEGGAGALEPGGTGAVRLHVRDLAALYSGHLTPAELLTAGALSGPADALSRLGLIFSGPRPWMPDMF